MKTRIKSLLEDNSIFIVLLLTFIIAYLSLISVPDFDIKISHLDKIYHFIAYFILTLGWLFYITKSHTHVKYKIAVAFFVLIFGIIIEVLQSNMTTYRTADYYDILANSIGILFAMLLFNKLFGLYKMI